MTLFIGNVTKQKRIIQFRINGGGMQTIEVEAGQQVPFNGDQGMAEKLVLEHHMVSATEMDGVKAKIAFVYSFDKPIYADILNGGIFQNDDAIVAQAEESFKANALTAQAANNEILKQAGKKRVNKTSFTIVEGQDPDAAPQAIAPIASTVEVQDHV
jgi:hypothetical protein